MLHNDLEIYGSKEDLQLLIEKMTATIEKDATPRSPWFRFYLKEGWACEQGCTVICFTKRDYDGSPMADLWIAVATGKTPSLLYVTNIIPYGEDLSVELYNTILADFAMNVVLDSSREVDVEVRGVTYYQRCRTNVS